MPSGLKGTVAVLTTALLTATVVGPAIGDVAATPRGESYYNYSRSRQAWFEHEYATALDYMKLAVEGAPGSAEVVLDLARMYQDLNDPRRAAETARRAVTLAPESVEARQVLAESLLEIAESTDATHEEGLAALRAYQDLIDADPENEAGHLAVARLQIARGFYDSAMETLRRHLQLNSGSKEGIFLAAQVLIRLERYEEAVATLRNAVMRHPREPRFRWALSEVHERMGDLEIAEGVARELLKMRTDPFQVRYALARLNQRLGRYGKAFEHLEVVSGMMDERSSRFSDSDRAEIRLRMIRLLLLAERIAEAVLQADGGIRRFPSDDRFGLQKGEILLLQGRNAEAREFLGEQSAVEEGNMERLAFISDAYLSAGAQRERTGDLETAGDLLKRSVELNPDNDVALNYLGYMLADQGVRLDEAIGYIERALESDPKNGAYLDSLGWAFYRKGDYLRAEMMLDEALAAMVEEPEIHVHLGHLYHATQRVDAAIVAWEEALRRGAENVGEIRALIDSARQQSGQVAPPTSGSPEK